MVTEVNHHLRQGRTTLGSSSSSQKRALSAVNVLANMYQRIPGRVLRKMEDKVIQNYAISEDQNVKHFRGFSGGHQNCNPCAKWVAKSLPRGSTLSACLRAVEDENATNRRLEKVKINFCDGYVVTFGRTKTNDPNTLVFSGEYDPSAKFSAATSEKAGESRAHLLKRLRFVSDDRGRPLKEAPGKTRSNSPLGVPKAPAPGDVSFCFTPMGMLSFAVRPNQVVPGVRPSLRNTNPQAVHYRPRALVRPLTPSVQEHAAGLILDGELPIDYRNSIRRVQRPTTAPTHGAPYHVEDEQPVSASAPAPATPPIEQDE